MVVNTIPLELKALQVSSVTSDDVDVSGFSQNGDLLHINLYENLTETDTATFIITYGGSPFHESWGGFHFSGGYAFNLGWVSIVTHTTWEKPGFHVLTISKTGPLMKF